MRRRTPPTRPWLRRLTPGRTTPPAAPLLAARAPAMPTATSPRGQAVAQNLGFTDGANNATVAASITSAPILAPQMSRPALLARSVRRPASESMSPREGAALSAGPAMGFLGNTTIGVSKAQLTGRLCDRRPGRCSGSGRVLPGLKQNGTSIRLNGAPRSDLGACTIFADGNAVCNGGNSGYFYWRALLGTNGGGAGCGIAQFHGQPYVPDPYSSASSHGTIPPRYLLGPGRRNHCWWIVLGIWVARSLIGQATSDSSGMNYGTGLVARSRLEAM